MGFFQRCSYDPPLLEAMMDYAVTKYEEETGIKPKNATLDLQDELIQVEDRTFTFWEFIGD